jgi:hypothetical protein
VCVRVFGVGEGAETNDYVCAEIWEFKIPVVTSTNSLFPTECSVYSFRNIFLVKINPFPQQHYLIGRPRLFCEKETLFPCKIYIYFHLKLSDTLTPSAIGACPVLLTYIQRIYSISGVGGGWDNVVFIGTCCGLDDSGFEFRWGRGFLHLSRPTPSPTQPPYNGYLVLSEG